MNNYNKTEISNLLLEFKTINILTLSSITTSILVLIS